MHINITFKNRAFKVDVSGDVSDLSLLSTFGYRESRKWAIASDNRDAVAASLTSRGKLLANDYVDYALYEAFCASVLPRMPADHELEFMLGFFVGVDEAVRELRSHSLL